MRAVVAISGGGIWGVMPAFCLDQIETFTQLPCYKLFKAAYGESTGAILGGQIVTGVPAAKAKAMYVDKGAQVFVPYSRWNPMNWGKSKYDRQPILNEMSRSWLQDSVLKKAEPVMKEALMDFVAGSVSIVDGKNHVFRSWERPDMTLVEAVTDSFAAAYYFGAITDPTEKQVWADGGEGTSNLPLMRAYVDCKNRGWLDEGVYILAIGCGYVNPAMSYEEAAKMGWIGQAEYYMGLARRQATLDQVEYVTNLMAGTKSMIDYVDFEIPKAWDVLDAVSHIHDGVDIASKVFPQYLPQILQRLKLVNQI